MNSYWLCFSRHMLCDLGVSIMSNRSRLADAVPSVVSLVARYHDLIRHGSEA